MWHAYSLQYGPRRTAGCRSTVEGSGMSALPRKADRKSLSIRVQRSDRPPPSQFGWPGSRAGGRAAKNGLRVGRCSLASPWLSSVVVRPPWCVVPACVDDRLHWQYRAIQRAIQGNTGQRSAGESAITWTTCNTGQRSAGESAITWTTCQHAGRVHAEHPLLSG